MPKILLPIGDATEALDTFYPFFRLPEDGFEVGLAAQGANSGRALRPRKVILV